VSEWLRKLSIPSSVVFPPRTRRAAATLAFVLPTAALGGGPRWIAGASYFNPSVAGHPLVWKSGIVNYYTDLGDLSSTVTQTQANAMVAQAAALWSQVPTAALRIHAAGSLAEDVSGSNFLKASDGKTLPEDIESSAIGTPVGVIYDADGAVLDKLQGEDASNPLSCVTNGVTTLVDNYAADASIVHALMIVNGRCTADTAHIALLQYELLRGFGCILGLDWGQANDGMFPDTITPDGLLGWPLMHPVEKLCNSNGNPCMTGVISPRTDDLAALNRLYPVNFANIASYPDKTAATATISIQGTISFRDGQGMQGVNVTARPLNEKSDEPDMRYPAATVSGSLFSGNAGNSVTGLLSGTGAPLARFGTDTATFEGWYELSDIPLPPGVSQADYQLTFEPVNPLYTGDESVGPYILGQITPSGTMPVIILRGLKAGSAITRDIVIEDSAADANSGNAGLEIAPSPIPITGEWLARLGSYGASNWRRWHMRGNRQVTIEAQPIDEQGRETEDKARIVVGVWNGDDPLGTEPAVRALQPFNAQPAGLTTLSFESGNDGDVRTGFADQRGDGRPDFLYRGRVLYADTVSPSRISLAGGAIVVDGIGFRPSNVLTVNGLTARITSFSPTEITAIAPASAGITGNVAVTVTDPLTQGWTTIEAGASDGLSYDSATGDEIILITAPANAIPIGVQLPFTVKALKSDRTAAAGVTVTFALIGGTAALGCGAALCQVVTGGDGLATVNVAPSATAAATVSAWLKNGQGITSRFTGATAPGIAAVNPMLSLAAGAVFNWTVQAIVLSGGLPYADQTVTWLTGVGATGIASKTISGTNGIAWTQVTVDPSAAGTAPP
jgi:hypothetical protein